MSKGLTPNQVAAQLFPEFPISAYRVLTENAASPDRLLKTMVPVAGVEPATY
jgi:hypothetical protein